MVCKQLKGSVTHNGVHCVVGQLSGEKNWVGWVFCWMEGWRFLRVYARS